jgi:hypothetical protein
MIRLDRKINASRQSRLQRRFGQETPASSVPVGESVSVNDQIFLDEKLERAVAFHIDRVTKWPSVVENTAMTVPAS